jgi:hypothetical protein
MGQEARPDSAAPQGATLISASPCGPFSHPFGQTLKWLRATAAPRETWIGVVPVGPAWRAGPTGEAIQNDVRNCLEMEAGCLTPRDSTCDAPARATRASRPQEARFYDAVDNSAFAGCFTSLGRKMGAEIFPWMCTGGIVTSGRAVVCRRLKKPLPIPRPLPSLSGKLHRVRRNETVGHQIP